MKHYRIEPGGRWYCRAEGAEALMEDAGLEWTYPWEGEEIRNGLRLRAYQTSSRLARMGCFMSHFCLWEKCGSGTEPILILEDDAVFTEEPPEEFDMGPFGAVSINDPRGATRRAAQYHARIQDDGHVFRTPCVEVPWVDEQDVPQGLPGHSAYMIRPRFAQMAANKAREIGAWPNDALMCKQFFPGLLGCSTTYYAKVSGRPSTLA